MAPNHFNSAKSTSPTASTKLHFSISSLLPEKNPAEKKVEKAPAEKKKKLLAGGSEVRRRRRTTAVVFFFNAAMGIGKKWKELLDVTDKITYSFHDDSRRDRSVKSRYNV